MSDGLSRIIPFAAIPDEDHPQMLGRHAYHDPRNRQFPARGVVFAEPVITRKSWWRRHVFNQGSESSCTAQGAAGLLFTSPFRRQLDRANLLAYDESGERFSLYQQAQLQDPWDGAEPTYYGTSTDAPFRVLRDRGQIREWRWCFGLQDVLTTISQYGPVVIGTNWHEGMDTPDRFGQIRPTGEIRGGHAYELYGILPSKRRAWLVNSWGRGWGIGGRAWLSFDDLGSLLQAEGEAVTAVL